MIIFFKKKEKEVKTKKTKKEELAEVQPQPVSKIKEKVISSIYQILKAPLLSEKATELTKANQYVFKVFPKANKSEIKRAIEDLYNVDVLDVKILKVPRKRKRLGRFWGWKKGYKKAIVKIKEGQKIEVLPR